LNWVVFVMLAWLALGLERGLKPLLVLQGGSLTLAPSFVMTLAVFIAMSAAPVQALWSCLGLGLMLDLLTPRSLGGTTLVTIVGPHALAYLLGAQLVLTLRGLVIRRNPISLAFLVLAFGIVTGIASTFLIVIKRMLGSSIEGTAGTELLNQLVSSGYSAILAFFLAFALLPMSSLLGVQTSSRSGHR
jgi:hypothetical protein